MSTIKIKCIDHTLTVVNSPNITTGNVNNDYVEFEFCQTWNGFVKTAIFYMTKKEAYYQVLDANNKCIIPKEVLAAEGNIYIGVFGVKDDITLTTEVLKYRIMQGALTENLKPSEPTPDIYEQLLSEMAEIKAIGDILHESVEAIAQNTADIQTLDNQVAMLDIQTSTDKMLENTDAGGLKINNIYGKRTQKSYSGAQLFDVHSLNRGGNTLLTISDDGYTITAKGGLYPYTTSYAYLDVDIVKGKTLYVGCDSITMEQVYGRIQVDVGNSDSTHSYYDTKTSSTFNVNIPEDAISVNVRIVTNNSSVALTTENTVVIKGLMISCNDADWEPYVGCISSPNPLYSQDINGVGYNNLLENTATSQTSSGITLTINDDKRVTLNGTATETTYFVIGEVSLSKGNYIANGCPANGSTSTYNIIYRDNNSTNVNYDTGNGAKFTLTGTTLFKSIITIVKGTTVNNLIFEPMIRKADVIAAEYVPYGKTRIDVKTINKNLLENTSTPATKSGVIFNNNANGSIYANGTATAAIYHRISNITLKADVWYTATNPNYNDGNSTIYLESSLGTKNVVHENGSEYNSITFTNTGAKFKLKQDETAYVWLQIYNGKTVNTTYYPMIRKADIVDDTYVKHESTLASIILERPLSEGDKIIDVNGVWKVERNTIEFGIDKCYSISETIDNKWYDSNISYSYELKQIPPNVKTNSLGLCTHFASYTFAKFYEKAIENGCVNDQSSYIVVNISKSLGICTTASEFKQWCIDNDVRFVKEITIPIYEELDTDSQIALNSLKTFYNITCITVNSVLEPDIEVEHGTSKVGGYTLESLLLAKSNSIQLAEVQAAILASGANV